MARTWALIFLASSAALRPPPRLRVVRAALSSSPDEDHDAELRRLETHAAEMAETARAHAAKVKELQQELEEALTASASASRELERAETLLRQEASRVERAARSRERRNAERERVAFDPSSGGRSGTVSNGWNHESGGGYVPDGLTPEEWRSRQAAERAPRSGLGAWGSRVGGASEPPRGDLLASPTIWTNPSAAFNEFAVESTGPAQERAPHYLDADSEDSEEASEEDSEEDAELEEAREEN